MRYIKEDNKIIIYGLEEFNIEHILLCGQVFRFTFIDNKWIVYSVDKMAVIEEFKEENKAVITTENPDYFVDYFDLNTSYTLIKENLKKFNLKFLNDAIDSFYGLRILKQDIFEVFFSFLISSNNNIKKIQKIIERLSKKFGENKGSFYAFPTFNSLRTGTQQQFLDLGLGYRADYFVKTLKIMEKNSLQNLRLLSSQNIKKELMKYYGVGEKVADCVMLFGYNLSQSFPCDVWIEKMYNEYFEKETNRSVISKNLVNLFGNLSGYAQQYLFFHIRTIQSQKSKQI